MPNRFSLLFSENTVKKTFCLVLHFLPPWFSRDFYNKMECAISNRNCQFPNIITRINHREEVPFDSGITYNLGPKGGTLVIMVVPSCDNRRPSLLPTARGGKRLSQCGILLFDHIIIPHSPYSREGVWRFTIIATRTLVYLLILTTTTES